MSAGKISGLLLFLFFSESWLRHASEFFRASRGAVSTERERLVIELASNDGYLLQYFVARGIPVLALSLPRMCRAAEKKGIPTLMKVLWDPDGRRVSGVRPARRPFDRQ